MSKRKRGQQKQFKSPIYGTDEPIELLDVQTIDDGNSMQFGTRLPDAEIFQRFSLGPWHELRRQMLLFTLHVRPFNDEPMSPRRDPGPEIDKRCDMWIVMMLQMVEERRLLPPPRDLRPWLHVRGLMALSYIDFEIRNQHKISPPDLKTNFGREIGIRLILFWEEEGKKRWLENDPSRTSRAE